MDVFKRRTLVVFIAMAVAPAQAQTLPDRTSIEGAAGAITITPMTHASVQVEYRGTIVQIDPAMGDMQKSKPADLILVTDIHEDHLNAGRIRRLHKDGGAVLMPAAAVAAVSDQLAFPVQAIANGERRTIGDIAVEAVAMYNVERAEFHTRGRGNGYIVTLGGKRLFFAGDTECVPEIKALTNIDVAFLPMNLPFTMSPVDAAECARAFKPVVAIPYHFQGSDPRVFVNALQGSGIEVRMLEWYPAIERPDRVAIAMPGRQVQVDGRRFHLDCSGTGNPTVILQGPPLAIDWYFVQPEIAKSHRVCSADPAGSGWSDPSGRPDSFAAAVGDLHAALLAAGEKPPFLLVGAGPGAIQARWFQSRFPGEVIGLVFVDGGSEDSLIVPVDGAPAPLWSLTAEQLRDAVHAFFPPGAAPPPRPPMPQEDEPLDRLPPDVLATRVTFQMRLDRARGAPDPDRILAELEADRVVVAALHEARTRSTPPLGRLPLVSLRAERDADVPFKAGQADLVTLTTNGVDRIVKRSGAEIHLYDPGAVVTAVQDVAQAAARGAAVRR
jgi:L-ascorbate metabolism protein UlaG (beta-lactamase superfamily)